MTTSKRLTLFPSEICYFSRTAKPLIITLKAGFISFGILTLDDKRKNIHQGKKKGTFRTEKHRILRPNISLIAQIIIRVLFLTFHRRFTICQFSTSTLVNVWCQKGMRGANNLKQRAIESKEEPPGWQANHRDVIKSWLAYLSNSRNVSQVKRRNTKKDLLPCCCWWIPRNSFFIIIFSTDLVVVDVDVVSAFERVVLYSANSWISKRWRKLD